MSSLAATSSLRRPDVGVTDRPILMAAPMVRATLRDEKRQTRRIVKPQPCLGDGGCWYPEPPRYPGHSARHYANEAHLRRGLPIDFSRYGQPGDRLWVRETFHLDGTQAEHEDAMRDLPVVFYRATDDAPDAGWVWRPSIHMPRWASRITLAVESVRVERLHDITEEDAWAEGVTSPEAEQSPCLKCAGLGPFSCVCRGTGHHLDSAICPQCLGERLHTALGAGLGVMEVDCTDCDTYRKRFRNLWNHINGAEAWAANPWVWVIGFSRVTP